MVNLYYKPNLTTENKIINWFQNIIDPVAKFNCPLQGMKCPSEEQCDCNSLCNNGEYVPFHIKLDNEQRIYVMDKKLSPGTYCLPKGVETCNLKTNYHVYSLAGWSCIPLNEAIFKRDKKHACKNEEAVDNNLNVLWDFKLNKEADYKIDDYYEPHENGLRYQCICGSNSIDGTPMVSVFPFVCSVDYCLRDIVNPLPFMGWNGEICECGPYFHLDPNDKKSPCRRELSRVENDTFVGRVDCMSKNSFLKQSLFCPTSDLNLKFEEWVSSKPIDLIDTLITKNYI